MLKTNNLNKYNIYDISDNNQNNFNSQIINYIIISSHKRSQ